jgi:hypothetical protein
MRLRKARNATYLREHIRSIVTLALRANYTRFNHHESLLRASVGEAPTFTFEPTRRLSYLRPGAFRS